MDDQPNTWFADDAEDDGGIHIDQYDITASPNDFNLVKLGSFIDRGAVRIPGFQRHFVWDLPRASSSSNRCFSVCRCRSCSCTRSPATVSWSSTASSG